MASIYIYNRSNRKCVLLDTPQINEKDIGRLKSILPTNLEGISFSSPFESEEEESVTDLRVEKRDQQVAKYLKNIGRRLEKLHYGSSALGFYDLALRLNPHGDLVLCKASVLSKVGHPDQAQELLTHYIQEHPQDPEANYRLGRLALSRNDYQTAQHYFAKANQYLRPQNVEHQSLAESVEIYARFVQIYVERDQLFDLSQQACKEKIKELQASTRTLIQDIEASPKSELKGMLFFLENQQQMFIRWLEELDDS